MAEQGIAVNVDIKAQAQPARFLAVAINGEVVRRAVWGEMALTAGDAVEIVRPLQGG